MEHQEKQDKTFISEQIRKKPFYRRKWFLKTVVTAGTAALFGGVAGVVFALVEPRVEKLFGQDQESMQIVLWSDAQLPKDDLMAELESSGLSVEVMTESDTANAQEPESAEKQENSQALYEEMTEAADRVQGSIVTVTGAVTNLDLFNESDERSIQSAGVVIARSSTALFAVTEWEAVRDASGVTVTFCDGESAEAKVHAGDEILGMAVVKVNLSDLKEETKEKVVAAALDGGSEVSVGTSVIAAGSPLGYSDSLVLGRVTSVTSLALTDSIYRFFATDMIGSREGSGILLDEAGNIIGFIAQRFNEEDNTTIICALDVTDLREKVAELLKGTKSAYLGLRGRDISDAAREKMEIPSGMFIREVADGSPAMHAGVQKADILTAIDGEPIENVEDYVRVLSGHEPDEQVKVSLLRKSMDQYVNLELQITLDGH